METEHQHIASPKTLLWRAMGRLFKNKYLLAASFFIIWMSFFDPKDWGGALDKNTKLKELQKSELHLTKTITETKLELEQLKTNAQTIEKYAREKYLMKKDNEDLFIISSASNK